MENRSLTSGHLALANLKRKAFRSGSMVVVVFIFAFTLFGGLMFSSNLQNGLNELTGRLGADILLVPTGSDNKMQSILLKGEPNQFYLAADLAEKVRAVPGVAQASPQLFIASLAAGCCAVEVQLIGFDQKTDFSIAPWTLKKLNRPLKDREIVVGASIIAEVGEELKFFDQLFTVAAKMDKTGMGFDASVFMDIELARQTMREGNLLPPGEDSPDNLVSAILVKIQEGADVDDVSSEIMLPYYLQYKFMPVKATHMFAKLATSLKSISVILYCMALSFGGVAFITLFTVFSSSLHERKREMSLLRILGATKTKLAGIILTESACIGLAGAVLGVLSSGVLMLAFSPLLFKSLELPHLQPDLTDVFVYGLLAFAAATLVGPLAGAWSAYRITKIDVYASLREGE